MPGTHDIHRSVSRARTRITLNASSSGPGTRTQQLPGEQGAGRSARASRASVLILSRSRAGSSTARRPPSQPRRFAELARQAVPGRPGLVRDAYRSRQTGAEPGRRARIRLHRKRRQLALYRRSRTATIFAARTSRPTRVEPSPWLVPPDAVVAAARRRAARHHSTPTAAWPPYRPARLGWTDKSIWSCMVLTSRAASCSFSFVRSERLARGW